MPLPSDKFLVCGLGSLGQHCVNLLNQFGVEVSAIDCTCPGHWDVEACSDLLKNLFIGDCRDPILLDKCDIQSYRSIILVTGDERVNIEAAFVARLKNPKIRLVIRSAKQNLNTMLSQQLDNALAIEPTEISSTAFALAAIGDETRGSFYLNGELVQVLERRIQENDPFRSQTIGDVNLRHPILAHRGTAGCFPKQFYHWRPETKIEEGDHLLFLQIVHGKKRSRTGYRLLTDDAKGSMEKSGAKIANEFSIKKKLLNSLSSIFTKRWYAACWQHRLWRLVWFCLSFVVVLLFIGSVLFYLYGPNLNLTDSIYAAVTLMLGGYFDLMGSEFTFDLPIPWWLRFFGLMQTIAGTILLGALYALITSHILATSFNFTRRTRFPDNGHVIVIGWGRIGKRITSLLTDFCQSFIVITKDEPQASQHIPILSGIGDTARALHNVNLDSAKAIISVTNDEMVNLELGLMAHRINPSCRMVLRTYHQRFGAYISSLFPYAHVLSSSVLSAEAFAAAAFGENIINLFIQNGQTILVTQYKVEKNDTLHGHILATAVYGYEIVPIVLVQHVTQKTIWMPSVDIRLGKGDKLTVLATMDSLRRVENGEMVPPSCELTIYRMGSHWSKLEGIRVIAKDTDCSLSEAKQVVENLPCCFPRRLYHHQGQQLLQKLRRMGYEANLKATGHPGRHIISN
jgi:Trk K+ transport system NAD-binding subunit